MFECIVLCQFEHELNPKPIKQRVIDMEVLEYKGSLVQFNFLNATLLFFCPHSCLHKFSFQIDCL